MSKDYAQEVYLVEIKGENVRFLEPETELVAYETSKDSLLEILEKVTPELISDVSHKYETLPQFGIMWDQLIIWDPEEKKVENVKEVIKDCPLFRELDAIKYQKVLDRD